MILSQNDLILKKKKENWLDYRWIDENEKEKERKFDEATLKELKNKRLIDLKLSSILNETLVYLVFLFFLYVVAYSNLSNNSWHYMDLFHSTFTHTLSPKEIGLHEVLKNIIRYFFTIQTLLCCFIFEKDNNC